MIKDLIQAHTEKGTPVEEIQKEIFDELKAIFPDTTERQVDDLDMQIKGSDRALKLMGVSTKDSDGTTVNVNFVKIANQDRKEFFDD